MEAAGSLRSGMGLGRSMADNVAIVISNARKSHRSIVLFGGSSGDNDRKKGVGDGIPILIYYDSVGIWTGPFKA